MSAQSVTQKRWSRAFRVTIAVLIVAALSPFQTIGAFGVIPTNSTYYVDGTTGSDLNPGTEAAPFETIGAAIDAVISGDTIVVAPGSYESTPTAISGIDDLRIESSGGADVTTLEGIPSEPVVVVEDSDYVEIDGFTITGGGFEYGGGVSVGESILTLSNCLVTGNYAFEGGGLAAYLSDVYVEGCEFDSNAAVDRGGAIGVTSSDLQVIDSTIVGNGEFELMLGGEAPPYTTVGGGVSVVNAEAIFMGTTIAENVAFGGAGVSGYESMIGFIECVVEGNECVDEEPIFRVEPTVSFESADPKLNEIAEDARTAEGPTYVLGSGGGVAAYSGLTVALDSEFIGNFAPSDGGGVQLGERTMAAFAGCTFSGNKASTGGGLSAEAYPEEFLNAAVESDAKTYEDRFSAVTAGADPEELMLGADLALYNTSFVGNEAYGAAAVYIDGDWTTEMTNCLIADNDSQVPGIVVDFESSLLADTVPEPMASMLMTNCTVSGNTAGDATTLYGTADWNVFNTVVWGNAMSAEPEDAAVTARIALPVDAAIGSGGFTYSDLEYGYSLDALLDKASIDTTMAGEGNFSADPMFRNPDAGDYRLSLGSPCIDTGIEEGAPPEDIDGWMRPVDGNGDSVAAWDIGAYEYYDDLIRDVGIDRYQTAVQASREHFEESEVVVIATGEVFADGLSAAGLAGVYGAPVLLSPHGELPALVKTEIERLGATQAILVGESNALSDEVAADLADMDLEVQRIGGVDRYETSALIADEILDLEGEDFFGIGFIARGDTFPDALSASPIAYALHAPILLVTPEEMPRYTVDIVDSAGFDRFVVVGGTSAVGDTAVQGVDALAERVEGVDRYDTSAALSEYAVEEGWSTMALTGIATGEQFPDALSGGAAIGQSNGVMLLTPYASLHDSPKALIESRVDEILRVEVLGGQSAVSDTVWQQLHDILNP